MTKGCFDALVLGAGSVGIPTALFLAEAGLKTAVIEYRPSPGQGENKAAIGGVRATHSDPAKILLCEESLGFFSTWEEMYGTSLGWKKGGYLYPVYRPEDRDTLLSLLPVQRAYRQTIDWINGRDVVALIPGIVTDGLLGGTWAPNDGQASPLLTSNAVYRAARRSGCEFFFQERVTEVLSKNDRVCGVLTEKRRFSSPVIINAAGAQASDLLPAGDTRIPIIPEIHEAGITCPMEQFLSPLVVDMRPGNEGETANFYFGQNTEGAVIFCYTPRVPAVGLSRDCGSSFLPIVARRMIDLLPRLRNALIRRTWVGHYPVTPDGLPIVGESEETKGFFFASGMCGQGFMLGPGVGKNLANLIVNGSSLIDQNVFATLRPSRSFSSGRIEVLT